MTQREPNHQILSETKKIRDMALEVIANVETQGTLSAWPYWKPPAARWEDKLDMTPQLIDQTTLTEMACDEIEKMKKNLRSTGYEPYTNHSNYQASVIPLLGGG